MNKKYTPKERRDIYLKTAEYIYSYTNYMGEKDWTCACPALANVSGCYVDIVYDVFPEFNDFKPDNLNSDDRWFGWHEGTDARVFCMLLCAEMTKYKV
jgi:hypothetical protein